MILLNLGNRSTSNSKKFMNVSQCLPTIKMAWFWLIRTEYSCLSKFYFSHSHSDNVFSLYGYILINVASAILIIYGLRPAFGKSNPKTVVLIKTEPIGNRVF